jgi:hypothetical protein
MKKLSLKFEELEIESFETASDEQQLVGTVRGHVSLASCSCQACATETDCVSAAETGCVERCSKDFQTGFYWQLTCIPSCQGYTCDYETCNCTNGC